MNELYNAIASQNTLWLCQFVGIHHYLNYVFPYVLSGPARQPIDILVLQYHIVRVDFSLFQIPNLQYAEIKMSKTLSGTLLNCVVMHSSKIRTHLSTISDETRLAKGIHYRNIKHRKARLSLWPRLDE